MNLDEKIENILSKYGDKIIIAAHHYQKDEIVKYANLVGDSYKLAVECSKGDAEFIVLCGVYFMAQSAALLAKNTQKVLIPETSAGCPMADMISGDKAEAIITKINKMSGKNVAPIVYMNSLIDSKAVCGKFDGSVCTSSNAKKIISYFLDQGRPVFFYPDLHLACNCANKLGIAREQMAVFSRDMSLRLNCDIKDVKMFLYDGYCHAHQRFKVEHIDDIKAKFNDINIIVHPECKEDVVAKSNFVGSTDFIYKTVSNAKPGSKWAIGTELNFVNRLASQNPDKFIIPLAKSPCFNMEKITLQSLANTLMNIQNHIENGEALNNLLKSDESLRSDAEKALRQMIKINES